MKNNIFLFCILLAQNFASSQHIERIEPPNWWIGMNYNTITLLVYGKNIAELQPVITYPDVQLLQSDTVENKNYLFITLRIQPAAKPGNIPITFRKKGKIIASKNFPILKRDDNSAGRESYTPKDAIYLIVPDRFANGDTTNDIIPTLLENIVDRNTEGKRHGGDIQGIIDHLDYIQSLGFTYIWCTPLVENDEPNYSYHGYAATDFYMIDPRFGTNELFRRFVQEAKKRDIGILWDVVLNHCGTEYYFIKDLPTKDWVNFPDTHTRSNFLKTTIMDLYASQIDKKEYTDGWFDNHMADLNQRNPFVAKYLIQNTLWWIEYAGISGLREDTYSYADKNFLAVWAKTILDEYPRFNIVGEEMTSVKSQTSYWQKDKKNSDGYESYLPTVMDFSLNENIISSLTRQNDWFSTWRDTYTSIAEDYLFPHPENQLIFPDNHDLDRFYTRLKKNFNRWKIGIALYMTMRGIPQFFYGTEVLMTNDKLGSDGQRRSDFYGGWKSDSKNVKTGEGLTDTEKEAKAYFSKLLNWRKTHSALMEGTFFHYAPQKNDVYVYFRTTAAQKVMILLNKNADSVSVNMNRYSEMIPSEFHAYDIVSDKELTINGVLTIPAETAMILEIK